MSEALESVIYTLEDYNGSDQFFFLYWIGMIYLFIFVKNKRKEIVYPSILITFIILNPILYKLIWEKILGYGYRRSLWLIPIIVVIAIAATDITACSKKTWEKGIVFIALVCVIAYCGQSIYSQDLGEFSSESNAFKLPEESIEVADTLLDLDDTPTVLAPYNLYYYMRQYNTDIKLVYGRDIEGFIHWTSDTVRNISNIYLSEKPDFFQLNKCLRDYGCNYVVYAQGKFDISMMKKCGFEYKTSVASYDIFEVVEDDNCWEITQYGADDDSQKMLYTITNSNGDLVIIDGGYEHDKDKVANIIASYGNHVSAWIITHPHPDHVGAFNAIMQENTTYGITIDKIYTVPVNKERYEQTAQDYDGIDSYEKFAELIADKDNVVYLNEGDEIDLIGLKMKVYSSWNEKVDELPDHLCNNGSLMFKVSGEKNSMLFCADVQSEMEQGILDKYRNEMQADYVQLGHHGNWGLTQKFYDAINPKEVFFDAPSSIVDATNSSYDAYLLKNYFEEKDVVINQFTSTPNYVFIE